MNRHKNAKLTARGREEMIRRMRHEPAARVAAGFGVSLRTARKWASRYQADDSTSLADRSSRPRRCRNKLTEEDFSRIAELRKQRRRAAMTEDTLPYGITPDYSPGTSFEAQYKRVFAAAECRTQTQLAAVLGVKQSSISDAKRRKSVPSEWLIKLFEKMRINPEWILTGLGDMLLCATGGVINIIERRPVQE